MRSRLPITLAVLLPACTACRPEAREAGPASATAGPPKATTSGIELESIDSGCRLGAAKVKVLVELRPTGPSECRIFVTPASVCIQRHGDVIFRIEDSCAPPAGKDKIREVTISSPRLKYSLEPPGSAKGRREIDGFEFRATPAGGKAAERRTIPGSADDGFYKYDITATGALALDPDVEVRGGNR